MSEGIHFTKMSGAGNDFIIIDNRLKKIKNRLPDQARRLCDRHFSVGADGLILLERSKKADIRMRILNPDGSEAEMCGNGVRCLAKFTVSKKITKNKLSVETLAGIIGVEVKKDTVKAKLVNPKDLKLDLAIAVDGSKGKFHFINTGVPHAVSLVNSIGECDTARLGRAVRFHEYFAPKGTNVDFIAFSGPNAIDIRTYERGVEAETLACGTGSVAGALVAAALKDFKPPVRVKTAGGETLKIYFSKNGRGFSDVYLEGKVSTNFEGRVPA